MQRQRTAASCVLALLLVQAACSKLPQASPGCLADCPAQDRPDRQLAAVGGASQSVRHRQDGWAYRVAGHLAQALPATRRILTSAVTPNTSCTPSTLAPEFDCMLAVTLPGDPRDPPPTKQYMHWSLAYDDAMQQPGIRFAQVVNPEKYADGSPVPPGWVGMGWSAWAPRNAPPAMINATALMGWLLTDGTQHLELYDLNAKTIRGIELSQNAYTVSNASITQTTSATAAWSSTALVLRFFRPFDSVFQLNIFQRMITAHHHVLAGVARHNHRAAIQGTFSNPGSVRVVPTRLNKTHVNAHAWCMVVVFAILFPAGIIWGRYFRDTMGRWYLVHIAIQGVGLLLALAAWILALANFRPIDYSLNHFQLGVAVMILVLSQPLSSIPRLMMHHSTEMKSVAFAYFHWTVGRAALVFGWVNMFFGIGRYQTEFNLGYWAYALLGFWIASIVIVCLIGEFRLWLRGDLQLRQDNDDLSRRLAMLERSGAPLNGKGKVADPDDELYDQMQAEDSEDGGSPPESSARPPYDGSQGQLTGHSSVDEERMNLTGSTNNHLTGSSSHLTGGNLTNGTSSSYSSHPKRL